MMKLIIAMVALACATNAVNAKDMFYVLAARWCSTEWTNKLEQFEITEQGVLYEGVPGEAPVCKLKSATNRAEAFAEHFVTWSCDPSPAHEPEDRPTPPSKFYEVRERLVPFMVHDSNGGRRFFMLRDGLPLGRRPVGIYEQCRD
jgi:hypothetical protein